MNLHILIVEDDSGLRQMLTWELEDLGDIAFFRGQIGYIVSII